MARRQDTPIIILKGKWHLLSFSYQTTGLFAKNNFCKFGVPAPPLSTAGAPFTCQFAGKGNPLRLWGAQLLAGVLWSCNLSALTYQRETSRKAADWLSRHWRQCYCGASCILPPNRLSRGWSDDDTEQGSSSAQGGWNWLKIWPVILKLILVQTAPRSWNCVVDDICPLKITVFCEN